MTIEIGTKVRLKNFPDAGVSTVQSFYFGDDGTAGGVRLETPLKGFVSWDIDSVKVVMNFTDEQIELAARAYDPALWGSFDRCVACWDRPVEDIRATYWFMVEMSFNAMKNALNALCKFEA